MNEEIEVWKKIEDFPMYEVSNMGSIRSWHKRSNGNIISQSTAKSGASVVVLRNKKGRSTKLVCDIVASEFILNPNNENCLIHVDGDKGNNKASNLKWCNRIDAINYLSRVEGVAKNRIAIRFPISKVDIDFVVKSYKSGLHSVSEISRISSIPKRRVVEIIAQQKRTKDNEGENWLQVNGFPNYFVSNLGRVKSIARYRKGRILKPSESKHGYLRVSLCRDGSIHYFNVHRLVANCHVPNDENKPQVNHIDGNKKNNFACNLEWCTQVENMKHAFDTGLASGMPGESHPMSKLSKSDVLSIKKERNQSGRKLSQLAEKYGVSESHISLIVKNKTWKHL